MFSGTPCISDHCQHIIIDSSQVNKNTVYIFFFFLVLQHSTALGENKIKMELNHDMFLMCLQVYIKHEVMWWCWHWSAVRVCRITIISSVCREDKSEQLRIGDSSLVSPPAGGDTGGGRRLYCGGVGGGGGGCIFHQTIYSGRQPDPRQSKFGVKVLYTRDIMIVLKIWDNIKHQYQIYSTSWKYKYIPISYQYITTIGAVMKNCLMTTISAGL